MLERLSSLITPRSAPRHVFIAVFVPVFLLVVATATLITFILPESYSSTTRLFVRQLPSDVTRMPGTSVPDGAFAPSILKTQFEIIQSEAVLGKVIDTLDLNQRWGKKYAGGNPLRPSETLPLLKARINLRSLGNSGVIDIRAFSDCPSEAATLANAITRSYVECLSRSEYRSRILSVAILQTAVPGLKPVRPNKPLNIALGILIGMVLALAAGAGTAGLAAWIGRRSQGAGAPPATGAVPPPDLPTGDGGYSKSTLA